MHAGMPMAAVCSIFVGWAGVTGALGLGRRAGQAGLSAGAAVGARVQGWD